MSGEKKIVGLWRGVAETPSPTQPDVGDILPSDLSSAPSPRPVQSRHPNDRRQTSGTAVSDASAADIGSGIAGIDAPSGPAPAKPPHAASNADMADIPAQSSAPQSNADTFGPHHVYDVADQDWSMTSDHKASRGFSSVAPAVAALAAISWCAFTYYAASDGFAAAPALSDWPLLIAAMAAPMALGLMLWLIISQSSPAAQTRFLRAAADLRAENAALNQSMASLSRHLADARQQLSEQAHLVQQLGLDAVLRMNDSSGKLADHAAQIANASKTLSGSADGAFQRMDGLLSGLPRVDDVAQRLAQNFREAGLAAHQHGAQLEAQIASLGDSSDKAARQSDVAVATLRDAIDTLQSLSQDTENGLVSASEKVAEVQSGALSAMSRGTAAIHKELDDSTQALSTRMEAMWQSFRHGVDDASAHLDRQISQAQMGGRELTSQFASHADQSTALAAQMQQLVEGVSERLSEVDTMVTGSSARIERAIDSVKTKLDAFSADVGGSNRSAQQLVQHSDALLLALDSVTRELDETLPLAFQRLNDHEKSAETALSRLKPLLEASELVAQSTLSHIHSAEKALQGNEAQLNQQASQQEMMAGQWQETLTNTEQALRALTEQAERFAGDSGAQMIHALQQVRDSAEDIAQNARESFATLSEQSRQSLKDHGQSAVDEAFRTEMLAQLESIELASHRAVAAANNASERLTHRLGEIIEASEKVEQRTAEAEQAIAASDRDTLAKQVSLLTEALKSTAIDMTKILSADVSDQAWESYLRGDRSVFARRAVKLLDHGETREILRLYQNDGAFHAAVNQFIHDFEAMLRLLMNARDGSAISVTLLSSDIGKIYVALAQSIDRLRN